jgi:hypothetical protein
MIHVIYNHGKQIQYFPSSFPNAIKIMLYKMFPMVRFILLPGNSTVKQIISSNSVRTLEKTHHISITNLKQLMTWKWEEKPLPSLGIEPPPFHLAAVHFLDWAVPARFIKHVSRTHKSVFRKFKTSKWQLKTLLPGRNLHAVMEHKLFLLQDYNFISHN